MRSMMEHLNLKNIPRLKILFPNRQNKRNGRNLNEEPLLTDQLIASYPQPLRLEITGGQQDKLEMPLKKLQTNKLKRNQITAIIFFPRLINAKRKSNKQLKKCCRQNF